MEPNYLLAWIEFLTGRFFFVIAGAIGVVVLVGVQYFSNKNIGVELGRDVLPRVYQSPMATAVFFSMRFVGICFYLGMLVLAGSAVSTTY